MRSPAAICGMFGLALVLGCSDLESDRQRVSGTVTFQGEPIPYGDILFTPDDAQKNSGPQGFATIRNGRFDTSSADGKGYGGGPAVIRITGLSAEGGTLLCEYEFRIELPRGDSTNAFDVPAKAAARAASTRVP
jgi:hypothetical protein